MTIKEIYNSDQNELVNQVRAAGNAEGKYAGLHLAGQILEQALKGKRLNRKKLTAALEEIRKLENDQKQIRDERENETAATGRGNGDEFRIVR